MSESLSQVISDAFGVMFESLQFAQPGVIVAYDAATQTANVQIATHVAYTAEDGSRVSERPPVITHVPVVFMSGANWSITGPVAAGDSVLVVFSSSSLDRWLALGGDDVDPEDDRRHHMSDAIAIPGLRSRANPITNAPGDRVRVSGPGPALELTDTHVDCGGTSALALASELTALRDYVANHAHPVTTTGTASAQTGTASAPITPPGSYSGTNTTRGA